jgi:hypothetical protein
MVETVGASMSKLAGEGPLAQREDTNYTVPQKSTTQQQPLEQAAPAAHKKGL